MLTVRFRAVARLERDGEQDHRRGRGCRGPRHVARLRLQAHPPAQQGDGGAGGASPGPGGSAACATRSTRSGARGIPMSVTRDKQNGTWYVQAWHKTYDGKRAHKVKRGFKTKPEALTWERDFYAVQAGDMDTKLVDFLELYKRDMGAEPAPEHLEDQGAHHREAHPPLPGREAHEPDCPGRHREVAERADGLREAERGAGSLRPTSRPSTTSSARSSTTPRASTASRRTLAAGPSPWSRSPPAR